MTLFNQTTAEEIIKLIEVALEPIDGKVEGFGDPLKTRHTVRYGNGTERKWVELAYPVTIKTKIGEDVINLSFVFLNRLWDMTWVACHYFAYYSNKISENDKEKILDILHSSEFTSLKK